MDTVREVTDLIPKPETRNLVLRVLDKLAEAQMRHSVENISGKQPPAAPDFASSQA